MATADKLTTVAQNVPKVYHAGQMNVIENAECLKGTKSDTAILLDDISPVTHEMGVKVRGKNLFDISKITNIGGITNNGDGTITIAANTYSVSTAKKLSVVCPDLKVGDVATLKFTTESSVESIYLSVAKVYWNSSASLTVTQECLDSVITIYGYKSTDTDYGNPCTISNIQIELGTTATAYTPHIPDLTAVTVSRYGKNLFDINSAELAKCTLTDDNGILFGSTGGAIDIIVPPGQYTLSFERNGTGSVYVRNGKVDSGYIKIVGTSDTSATFNFTGTVDGYLRIHTFASNLKLKNIQLELSSTASSYQAYQGGTYTPSADGTVSGVTNIYPVTTLFTDTDSAVINVNYYKDIDKTVNNLKTLIALSGGE